MSISPFPDTYRPFNAEDILGKSFAPFLPVTLAINGSIAPLLSLIVVSWKHLRHTLPVPQRLCLLHLDHQAAFALRIGAAGTMTSTSPVATS